MWTHLANGCSVADWDAMEMKIYSRERCKWQFRWCTKRCWLRKLQRFIANKLKLHEGWSETNQEIFIFNIIHHFHTPLHNFQFQCLTSNEVLILCSVKSSCRVTRFLFFIHFLIYFLSPATSRCQRPSVTKSLVYLRPHIDLINTTERYHPVMGTQRQMRPKRSLQMCAFSQCHRAIQIHSSLWSELQPSRRRRSRRGRRRWGTDQNRDEAKDK